MVSLVAIHKTDHLKNPIKKSELVAFTPWQPEKKTKNKPLEKVYHFLSETKKRTESSLLEVSK